jgi:TolB-like protein/DNA-binding winged helix-turn-helix (wHTH) protein/Tfp pilus assembly protein PilF
MSASAPAPAGVPNVFRFGVFELDVRALELRKAGRRIHVQQQPLQILALLLGRQGEVVTRDELRAALWASDVYVDFDRGLNKAMVKLREALDDSANAPRFIETLPRVGYRFIAAEGAKQPVALPPQARSVPLLVAAAALVVVIAGAWVAIRWPRSTPIRSIAVLPLENLSGDPSQEYFADGMTDELTTALAQIGQLRVISRTSAMRYKTARKSAPEIARELNVEAVLEGSVTRAGNRVRITAQLIDALHDKHLWARSYEGEAKDVLGLQDAVARDVADIIRLNLSAEEQERLTRRREVDPQAHEAYLTGLYYWNRRDSINTAKALQAYQRAVAIDPSYAPAYAGIAQCNIVLIYSGNLRGTDVRPLVAAALNKALTLDPASAEAHTALAGAKLYFEYDWAAAEHEYRHAIELNPNYVVAHQWYAQLLGAEGRTEEELAHAKAALALDPLSVATINIWGQHLYRARRFDEAAATLNRVIGLEPDYASARWNLALVHIAQKRFTQAIAELQKVEQRKGNANVYGGLGLAYAMAGDTARAKSILEQLVHERSRYVDPWSVALVYTGLGDRDQAFVWLQKAIDDRDNQVALVNNEPALDSLRSDPRFAALLRRMGVPVSQ